MRIGLFLHPHLHQRRVGLVEGEYLYDLTAADPEQAGTLTTALAGGPSLLADLAAKARAGERWPLADEGNAPPLLAPIEAQEVWGAGVTYWRSREARMGESVGGGDFYDRVYTAERPELFFKATPHRVVGPNQPVGIRRDSRWSVPEPELALVLTADLRLAGYTIGNDMSARDIEGENPLYLPQAKIYSGSCALGPAILLDEENVPKPHFDITLTIYRDGAVAFQGETSTAHMRRSFADLVSYLGRANTFPNGVILLTGTGIVPPDDFALREGDVIEIAVPSIGVLRNPVCTV